MYNTSDVIDCIKNQLCLQLVWLQQNYHCLIQWFSSLNCFYCLFCFNGLKPCVHIHWMNNNAFDLEAELMWMFFLPITSCNSENLLLCCRSRAPSLKEPCFWLYILHMAAEVNLNVKLNMSPPLLWESAAPQPFRSYQLTAGLGVWNLYLFHWNHCCSWPVVVGILGPEGVICSKKCSNMQLTCDLEVSF